MTRPGTVRLDRLLANCGYGSRREVGALVRARRVTIDGEIVRDTATAVRPVSVAIDGEPIDHVGGVLVALHKPAGFVCSHAGTDGDVRTVYSLLPPQWQVRKPRPEAVGRLDKETSGLLIVTDDHALLHRLIAPRSAVPKTYVATLARAVDESIAERFASGTLLLRGEDTPCAPAALRVLATNVAEVTIIEGRYHQVRRMFAACGNHVDALHRVGVGDWTLDDLALGHWRDLPPRT